MEFNEIIARRRSIRKFAPQPIESQLIEEVLSVALAAPSSRNSRSTHFLVVDNPASLSRISTMRDYGSSFLDRAPAAIVVLGDSSATDLWQVNASIAATMLQLACVDRGLASCWVQVDGRPQQKDNPDGATAADHLREFLPIAPHLQPLCIIAIGHSNFIPAPLPESDDAQRVVWVK